MNLTATIRKALKGKNRLLWPILAGAILLCVVRIIRCGKSEPKALSEYWTPNSGHVIVETVKTDDFSMDYCKFGTGEHVLVVLPGLSVQSVMGSADAIAEAFKEYKDDFTVYVFERRNTLPASYRVADSARDTVEAIHAIGLKKVSLFGASYGGMVSMEIAAENPELVDKMILASTAAKVMDEEYKVIENWSRLAEKGDATELYLAFGEALYPKEVFEQSRQLMTEAAKTVTAEDLKRFVILAEGIKGFDASEHLDRILCPVLLVGDEQDRVLGVEATKNIAKQFAGHSDFELYLYDGYGHAVYDTAPDFRNRMLQFLKKDRKG
jgi:pimeloyl-ACP methyl ester carboxylesterase